MPDLDFVKAVEAIPEEKTIEWPAKNVLQGADVFVTGGAGTLGWAIARRRQQDGWTGRLTVYSTDDHKHAKMRAEFPDIDFIQGDIRHAQALHMAMVGHEVVIHAAAVKVIPTSEYASIDTLDVNVLGSQIVCDAAVRANIRHVLGISTDKACYPANAYGASKMLMEKVFQEYARAEFETAFHLVRYGNVLESNGSVVQAWKRLRAEGRPIQMTDPDMTRFWLSPSQAVQYLMDAFCFESGLVYIPKVKALSIGKLAEYTVQYTGSHTIAEAPIEKIPMRPGEKMHETLLTEEEGYHAFGGKELYLLSPSTSERYSTGQPPYSSNTAQELTQMELLDMLND
jgi:UDP-N-acetylglucosamine 4,6-dehydratase